MNDATYAVSLKLIKRHQLVPHAYADDIQTVSYTHLTLPTIYSV